jgi:hypothetical protein
MLVPAPPALPIVKGLLLALPKPLGRILTGRYRRALMLALACPRPAGAHTRHKCHVHVAHTRKVLFEMCQCSTS